MVTKEELANTRIALKEDLANFRQELKSDISELDTKISAFKSDIMNWMLFLYIITMIAILGLYLKH